MPDRLFSYLNAAGLLALSGVLGFAFADQLIAHELPCPLCLLQRMAMFGVGVGLVLNIAVTHEPRHYAMMIISAVLGLFIAMRQVLLHIVPGTGEYGSPFFGLHFYTWAFILFLAVIAGASLMLLVAGNWPRLRARTIPLVGQVAIGAFFLLALANVFGTLFECGFGACPDDPTRYEWLEDLFSGMKSH